ncbi:MAG: YybH family protein [Phycisphaerae bacterium]
MPPPRTWICAGILALAAASGCVAPRGGPSPRSAIRTLLDRQAASWNGGDIHAFMQAYHRSPDLTFSSGGTVTRGWAPTLANYRRRYPTREAMGHLTFSDLEITLLGPDAALVLGRWHLDRDEPVGGAFSLVLRRTAGAWRIIHDHTSRDAP